MFKSVCLFSGNANVPLAQSICANLDLPLGRARVARFSDGEIAVEIGENVRGKDVYLLQPTCSPPNDSLMELLIMADAVRRSSAGNITAVIPYFGYARQDRKVAARTPITAKLVADLIVTAGIQRVLTIDLHAGQIQGFFNIPVDNLFAMPVLLEALRTELAGSPAGAVMVSPDAGGVERTRAYAKRLDAGLAIIDKRRERANVSEVMHIIGDVDGKDCVILDDMVDTAGTLGNAARALKDRGARRILACATHAILSGPALQRIEDSPLEKVIVTDTIPSRAESGKIKQVTVARLLAEAIKRIHNSDSVSSLFV